MDDVRRISSDPFLSQSRLYPTWDMDPTFSRPRSHALSTAVSFFQNLRASFLTCTCDLPLCRGTFVYKIKAFLLSFLPVQTCLVSSLFFCFRFKHPASSPTPYSLTYTYISLRNRIKLREQAISHGRLLCFLYSLGKSFSF